LNELMPEEEPGLESETIESDTSELVLFRVPAKLDFLFTATMDEVVFDDVHLENLNGQIIVKDEEVVFKDVNANLFEGKIGISGLYSTKDPENAKVDFGFDVENIKVSEGIATFPMLKKYAPILEKTTGSISTDFNFTSLLGNDYSPVYSSLNGDGFFKGNNLVVQGSNALNMLGDKLNIDSFKQIDLKNIDLSFDIKDGKFIVKPFDVKMGDMTANIAGSTSIDQSIDYKMGLNLPTGKLGEAANDQLNKLLAGANLGLGKVSVGDKINLDVLFGGTTTNPTIKTGLGKNEEKESGPGKEIVKEQKEDLKKKAQAEAGKILKDADKKGKQLVSEAQKQAAKIKAEARKASAKIKTETAKKADELIATGKKKWFFGRGCCKKGCKKIAFGC
jgi:AsmA-like protein